MKGHHDTHAGWQCPIKRDISLVYCRFWDIRSGYVFKYLVMCGVPVSIVSEWLFLLAGPCTCTLTSGLVALSVAVNLSVLGWAFYNYILIHYL